MKLEDYHTHSELCHHADGTIEEYVNKAIKLKLYTIGICDHFPYEFLENIERIPYTEYAITIDEIEKILIQTIIYNLGKDMWRDRYFLGKLS